MKKQIYESEGVYGDEKKFLVNDDRFNKMIAMVKSMKPKPEHVLDIGCGTGFFSNKIKEIYPVSEVYGIDISQKALTIGKKQFKNINFKLVDAEGKLPFVDNFFRLVISGEHIEHLKDPDTYLSEINRVMKKHGTLILTTPNLGYWLSRILLLFGKQPFYLEPSLRITLPIIALGKKTFPEDLDSLPSGHLRLYTLDMLTKLLKAYGFSVIESKGKYMLKNFPFKQLDQFFSNFPSLAFGFILKIQKI